MITLFSSPHFILFLFIYFVHVLINQGGYGIMKALDMAARSKKPPISVIGPISRTEYNLRLLLELRYESFDISTARAPKYHINERNELLKHLLIVLALQLFPQNSLVKAYSVLFAIYCIWTVRDRY